MTNAYADPLGGEASGEDQTQFMLDAAMRAHSYGFYDQAIRLYDQVSVEGDEKLAELVKLNKIRLYLEAEDYPLAKQILSQLGAPGDPKAQLLAYMLYYLERRQLPKAIELESISNSNLAKRDRVWLSLLTALAQGKSDAFELAKEEAKGEPALLAQVELWKLKHEFEKDLTGRGLNLFLESVSNYDLIPSRYVWDKQYAIGLYRMGRIEDAVQALEEAIERAAKTAPSRVPELMLLQAIAQGVGDDDSYELLERVLRTTGYPEQQRVALRLLAQAAMDNDELRERLLETYRNHNDSDWAYLKGFKDEYLIVIGELLYANEEYSEANKVATEIVTDYPGSDLSIDGYGLLAHTALKNTPPQYRLAADYFIQVSERAGTEEIQARATALAADCYFLNGDYSNAITLYKQAIDNLYIGPGYYHLFYQYVLSLILDDQLDGAQKMLNASNFRGNELRWKAEWNLAAQMTRKGEVDKAHQRVKKLVEPAQQMWMGPDLRLRLLWLQSFLLAAQSRWEEAVEATDRTLEQVEAFAPLDVELGQRIIAQSHLTKGQALLRLERSDEAQEEFQKLRSVFPGSEAAAVSYIDEARYYLSSGRVVEAQQRFIALADAYPENNYVPVALYEAALAAESVGLDRTYQEAISILERLVDGYSEHTLVFQARLKQGDLFRKLGQFPAAQGLYEDLVNRNPDHPARSQAMLSLAYCHLAAATQDDNRYEDAYNLLEGLFNLEANAPDLRIEAGHHMALALERQGKFARAGDIYWLVVIRFMLDEAGEFAPVAGVGSNGRYWLSRTLFNYASVMERQNLYVQAERGFTRLIRSGLPGKEAAKVRLSNLTPFIEEAAQ